MTLVKSWSTDEDTNLTTMALGGASATDIGKALQRSRNSVCGRAWRLGVTLRGASHPASKPRLRGGNAKPRGPKRRLEPRLIAAPLVVSEPVNMEALACKPVDFLSIGEGCCKWPIENLFCNAKALPRRPYCAQHTYISHKLAAPAVARKRTNYHW